MHRSCSMVGCPEFSPWPAAVIGRCWSLAAGALVLTTAGCSSKKYVRSQVAPVVQQTNDLDAKTSQIIARSPTRMSVLRSGINGAMGAANTADQHAQAAGTERRQREPQRAGRL